MGRVSWMRTLCWGPKMNIFKSNSEHVFLKFRYASERGRIFKVLFTAAWKTVNISKFLKRIKNRKG